MNWISVKDRLPEIGETTKCRVHFHRHFSVYDAVEVIAKYVGVTDAVNMPMWDIDTGDEAFAEVTHWMPQAK